MVLTQAQKVFAVSWVAYGSSYFLRKPIGVLKPAFEKQLGFDTTKLGFFDVALLLPYALVQMFCGHWVGVYGARQTFAVCLWLSAAATVTFGLWTNFGVCLLLITAEGAAQALLWPCCVRLIDQWVEGDKKTSIFGIFNTCAFAGGIAGTFLAVGILGSYGWSFVYPLLSFVVAAVGVAVYFTCHEKEEFQKSRPKGGEDESEEGLVAEETTNKTTNDLSWKTLWQKPGFADVCVCMLCLKVNRYFVYMWLPYLYTKEFGYSEEAAGTASTGFEVGGFFGSLVIGFVIDAHFGGDVMRGTAYAVCASSVALLAFIFSSSLASLVPLWLVQLVFIGLNGLTNAGSDAMLGSAVPTKLGKLYGGSSAAITGLINGFGTLGSFIQGPMSGIIGTHFGWMANLYIMWGLSVIASITAIRAMRRLQSRFMFL